MTDSFNDAGAKLIKTAEGLRLSAYQDQGGVWTVGYGHAGPEIGRGVVWTQAQADDAFDRDVSRTAEGVLALLVRPLGDDRFSALVSFAYNEGLRAFAGSSVRTVANSDDPDGVPARLALWDKVTVRGRLVVSHGLLKRRWMEALLWRRRPGDPIPDFRAVMDGPAPIPAQFGAITGE